MLIFVPCQHRDVGILSTEEGRAAVVESGKQCTGATWSGCELSECS